MLKPIQIASIVAFFGATASVTMAASDEGTPAHDPCVTRDGTSFYLFSTGGKLAIRRSADLRTWEHIGHVFDELPAWTFEAVPGVKGLWAPDIIFMNGEYNLYYSVSTFGSNRSCIGLATNKTLDPNKPHYHWVDKGRVIESRPGRDDWNAIDPNVILEPSGQPWLAFGSFWSGIKLTRLNRATGKPFDDKLIALARRPGNDAVEAPFLIRNEEYYYAFVSFDKCCKGVDSNYKIVVGRSKNITGPYVDRMGKPMMDGGGTLVLAGYGSVRGPGHNAIFRDKDADWLIHHYYDANANGRPFLHVRPLIWAKDGWPLAGEPLDTASLARELSPVGTWEHMVNFGEPSRVALLASGAINKPDGAARWTLNGRNLFMRWPRRDAPGGAWVDELVFAPNGQSYVGRNKQGMVIRGLRKSE